MNPGFNSGWENVQGIRAISNQRIHKVFHDRAGLVNLKGVGNYSLPQFVWNKTVEATDIEFLNSDRLGKNYKSDMFVGDFNTG